MSPSPTRLETARATIHAWQCDHMGHANLRAYGEIFEQALWHVFTAIGLTPTALRTGPVHMAGVQQNISYKKELYPGDCVAVRSTLIDIQAKRLTMRHELVNVETQEVCATCELTAVCIARDTRRPVEFPPHVAAAGRQLLAGGSVPA
ncbi:thioesterase family protein [Ramlibacter sp.]|uniref:acyl-CoA thioesterase n=1 Tax=Ramlibacter sp. TaxID=1917967 RepID=UPI002D39394F|nr:thioesterase family protein [Ramlibacter sp.]HYD75075.1 thioesterase family protein [Ramlibacter sp.]